MRLISALLCAALLAACHAPRAGADELDDLLTSQPASTAGDAPLAAPSPSKTDFDFSGHGELDYRDGSRWQSPALAPVVPVSKAAHPSKATAPKPAPRGDFNVVPEPSAIVLGVLALLYFLVFGRRRNLA